MSEPAMPEHRGRAMYTRLPRPVILAVAILASAVSGSAFSETRDRVITYFDHGEWRIFDPARRTDELFLKLGTARGVYWDTTETYVEYLDSGQLFRIEWELDAQPWLELQVPQVSDWWFNRDSLCWQASSGGGVPRNWARGEAPYTRCHSDLWQSDRDGTNWRIIRSDTTNCGGCYFCEKWQVSDSSVIRRRAAIGLNQLQASMTIDRWGGTPVAIPPPTGEPPSQPDWYYIPFRTAPGRGLALRIGHRSPDLTTFRVPFYLIDRRRGTQRPFETPHLRRDADTWHVGMAEHDGFLLVSGIRTYAYDLNTGDQIFLRPGASPRNAVWIKRPVPARVDTVGLRRLRERFR